MKSILAEFFKHAQATPEKIAIVTKISKTTYKEVADKSRIFAENLKARGVKKGNRVVIEAVDLPMFFTAYLGCMLAGAVAVPIEKNISIYKLQEILKATRPSLVFYKNSGESYKEFFKGDVPQGKIKFPKEDAVSTIVSTTGTTGNHVFVTHTNKSMLSTIENLCSGVGIDKDSVMFSDVPFWLSAGYRRVLATLYKGATAVITYKPLEEDLLLEFFEEYGINCLCLAYSKLNFLLRTLNPALEKKINNCKYVETVSGSLSSAEIVAFRKKYPDCTLFNMYGATEAGCVLINDATENSADKCLGKPSINAEVFIVDENGNRVATCGEYGYIASRGDMVMQGYYRKKALTDSVLKDGTFISSDIGYFDEDGYFYFVSRVGDIIEMDGHKIIPTEIEEVAMGIDIIIDCACVGHKSDIHGQVPALYVCCDEGKFDEMKIRDALDKSLEDYKVPSKIILIDKIPKTLSGKIMRKHLRK